MDLERALRRVDEFARRIRRAATLDFTGPDFTRSTDGCPGAAYGQHSEPNWRGWCSYCGKRLSAPPRLSQGRRNLDARELDRQLRKRSTGGPVDEEGKINNGWPYE